MSNFTVEQVLGSREWTGPKGVVRYYDLKLEGVEGTVSRGHPEGGFVPTPGYVYENCAVEETDRGKKLVKLDGFTGGKKSADPGTQRSIAAQHAQKAAVDIVTAALAHGQKAEDIERRVKEVAARLFAQIEDLKDAA